MQQLMQRKQRNNMKRQRMTIMWTQKKKKNESALNTQHIETQQRATLYKIQNKNEHVEQ